MVYNSVHRFLLRSVASRGVLSKVEVEQILNKFTENNMEGSVEDYIQVINKQIKPFQQMIKITSDEVTNEEVLIFLSLGYDDATAAQGVFNASELEFFRLLIEDIMTTDTRQVTGIRAMNLVGKMKGSFTKIDAENLLNLWCTMRYLDKDGDNYALGVRAIHEFESYLRQNMPDTIEECCLCKQIVFRGYNCPSCALAIHTRCLNRYLEKVEKWPCCKTDFNQSQLERLNNCESSRLTQTQMHREQSAEYNAVMEPASQESSTEDIMITQEIIPEISQRLTRKRKRLA